MLWKYESYLQKGLSHIQSAANCQDSVLIRENDRCIVAALADGLGSLKYSEIAAQTVTHTVCEAFLDTDLPAHTPDTAEDAGKLKQNLILRIKERLQLQAEQSGISIDEMDCTMVFVCISKQYGYAIAGRLGDSAVCVIKQTDSVAINDSNRSANGTHAVLDKDAADALELYYFDLEKDGVCGFILTSDGLDNELYMKGSPRVSKSAERYFNAVSTQENPKTEIETAIRQLTSDPNSPFDDDISLAVLSCVDAPLSFASDPTWLCRCGARNRLQDTYCCSCGQDFSLLYQNIRFKEHGGKAAFFAKINATPDQEKELAGITKPAANDTPSPAPQPKTPPAQTDAQPKQAKNAPDAKQPPVQNRPSAGPQTNAVKQEAKPAAASPKKKKHSKLLIGCLAAFAVTAVSGLLLVLVFGGVLAHLLATPDVPAVDVRYEEMLELFEREFDDDDHHSRDYLLLAEGSYYLGETHDGVPHGDGVLYENGQYYLGEFEHGKKDGRFQVVQSDDDDDVEIEYYEDGIPVDPDASSDTESSKENNESSKEPAESSVDASEEPDDSFEDSSEEPDDSSEDTSEEPDDSSEDASEEPDDSSEEPDDSSEDTSEEPDESSEDSSEEPVESNQESDTSSDGE